jgi:hypothetical protein
MCARCICAYTWTYCDHAGYIQLQTLIKRGVAASIIREESRDSGFRGASAFSELPYMDMQWSFPPEYMHMTKNNVHRIMEMMAGLDYTEATMTAIRDFGMHPGMIVIPHLKC